MGWLLVRGRVDAEPTFGRVDAVPMFQFYRGGVSQLRGFRHARDSVFENGLALVSGYLYLLCMTTKGNTMTKTQAIKELTELDRRYDDKGAEARFWGNEYRLAGSASKNVKASQKPIIEARYQTARADQEVIWNKMTELMDTYGIGADDLL